MFLSSYPPEQNGLATFTMDSADSVDLAAGRPVSSVIAIEKTRSLSNANGRVAHVIHNPQRGAYRRAALVVNEGPCRVNACLVVDRVALWSARIRSTTTSGAGCSCRSQ